MATGEIARTVLALAIGLVLGSVLPADFFARSRGVDIRSRGDGNPGTINAFRVLGRVPGLVTAVYDLAVGVVAIQIAGLLGVSTGIAYLAGIATIVGHRFPVFRGFRGGGQGMAASAGMLVYGVVIAVSRGWLSMTDVGILVAILLITFGLTRSDKAAAIVMLPFLVSMVVLASSDRRFAAFLTAVAAYIWIVQLFAVRHWFASRAIRPMHGRARD